MRRRYRTAYLPAAQQRALSDQVTALVRVARLAGQAQAGPGPGPDQEIPVGADNYRSSASLRVIRWGVRAVLCNGGGDAAAAWLVMPGATAR